MNGLARLAAPRRLAPAIGPEAPAFAVPARYNPRLQARVERINGDDELWQWWRCANVNALDRLGLSDHGEVHARIVANAALRLLRLLRDAGPEAPPTSPSLLARANRGRAPGVVAHHHLGHEEAEVVVVLAAALHDVGMAMDPEGPAEAALALATPKAAELLSSLYPPRERTILVAETLQAMAGHRRGRCLTLEAGVLHLADVLDLGESTLTDPAARAGGRARPAAHPRAAGGTARSRPGAHAEGQTPPAAFRVEAVTIRKGARCPVRVELQLGHLSDRDELRGLLEQTLWEAALDGLVEIAAGADGALLFTPAPQLEGSGEA